MFQRKGINWGSLQTYPLNKHVHCPYFKNEGINTVCDLLDQNDHLLTVDLKDGFHHVSVNPEFRTFLGFCWKNQFYVWNVLPFRLRSSPWFFNKLIRCVVQYLRSQNLKLSFWVDDCLLMGKPEDIDHVKSKLLGTLDQLLLCINWEKSSLEPSYTKEYIGYIVNSSGPDGCPCIKIPNRRVNKLKRDICRALRAGFIKARFLARICGQIISFSKAIIPSKLLVRNLYCLLRSRTCWDSVLHLDEACTSDMKWWLSAFKSWNGCSVLQHSTDIQITTDASATGWGAICGRHEASGLWNVNQIYEHSNYRELMTVVLALKSFKPYIEGKTVQLLSDNIVTVAYINHLGGPCPKLTELAKAIYAEAFALRNLTTGRASGRMSEHYSRPPQSPVPTKHIQLVDTSSCVPSPGSDLGVALHRSICGYNKSCASPIQQPIPRPPHGRGRRSGSDRLGRTQQLCKPPFSLLASHTQNYNRTESGGHSDSPMVASPAVVQYDAEIIGQTSLKITKKQADVGQGATPRASEKSTLVDSCLADIWAKQLVAKGWAREPASITPFCLANSTMKSYNRVINNFREFCVSHNSCFPPLDSKLLANYLCEIAAASKPKSLLNTTLAALTAFYRISDLPNPCGSDIRALCTALVKTLSGLGHGPRFYQCHLLLTYLVHGKIMTTCPYGHYV